MQHYILLSGGALIDVDGTLFVQLAIFALAFFMLKTCVFGPVIRLMDARFEAIDGAKAEAKALSMDAGDKEAEFDGKMRQLRSDLSTERDEMKASALEQEAAIISKAQSNAETTLKTAFSTIEKHMTEADASLSEQVPHLASLMASKLLGREVKL